MDNQLRHKTVKEDVEVIEGAEIRAYLVRFDAAKDFSEDLRAVEGRGKRKKTKFLPIMQNL